MLINQPDFSELSVDNKAYLLLKARHVDESVVWKPESKSLRLFPFQITDATVLFVDIRNFTATCASMAASDVGAWVIKFYHRVEKVAAGHKGVVRVEVRGDCCVCVVTDRANQATRMLDFAVDLQLEFAASVRIGVASGPVTFLVNLSSTSLFGETVASAERAEASAPTGPVICVHESTASRWADEGVCRDVPFLDGDGFAFYDCQKREFKKAGSQDQPMRLQTRSTAFF